MEWWVFCSLILCGRGRTHRGSHPRSSNDCVCDGGVHTLVARTFFWCTYTARTLRTFLCVLHTCKAQGSRVSAVRMSSSLCHLTFSLLMFHPSLLLLFIDGHFETFPDLDDLTDVSVHAILPNFPDLKAQVKHTPHEDGEFGYLAKSDANTGNEPKKSLTRILPWMMTRRPSTMRITIPPTSRKPRTRTQANSVFTQRLNPLFCTFLIGDLVPQRESKESMQSGNLSWTEREKVLWQVLQSRCQRKVNGTVSVWVWRVTENPVLKSHKEFYSDERDLRGHLEWRAQQANSVPRKFYSTEYGMEIQNERRNSECASFESQRGLESQRLQLLEERCSLDRSSSTWKNTFL